MKNESNFIKRLLGSKERDRAFSELVNTYQERLYWHIRKLVGSHENADDVLQNTFVRIYKSLPNFKQQSSLHTWMYKIAYNESLRFIDREKNKYFSSSQEIESMIFTHFADQEYFDGNYIQEKLQSSVQQLSNKQKKIFYMKYYDDLKFKEISEILEVKEGTVKTIYYKAVDLIKQIVLNVEVK
ncbi:MAG: RNA polymerase sigma factor [Wenyingzhuangia sp.]|uniref:RNA polymerase sigma factor n=1 Tax=Wenyingzhuangia sp. TaxID=1964193 RepID=UPI00321C2493